MFTKAPKTHLFVGLYSIIAGIFLFWQLAYNGEYRDLALIMVGVGFIGILIVASLYKRAI